MPGFIKFTREEKDRARQTNLAEFLAEQGEEIKRSGSEFVWLDGSQKVTLRGHLWFHQYEQKGGDAIDFVRRYYNKNYIEAVQMLLGNNAGMLLESDRYQAYAKPKPKDAPKESFALPPKNDSMRRLFAYLLMMLYNKT